MTRTCRRICDLLTRLGYVWPDGAPPADTRIWRTNAGWHQRAGGTWSWCLFSTTGRTGDVGSQLAASKLLTLDPACLALYVSPWGSVEVIREKAPRGR